MEPMTLSTTNMTSTLKETLTDLSQSFEDFKETYNHRLKALERSGIEYKRPLYELRTSSDILSREDQAYREAFAQYIRKGDEARLLDLETKALTSASEEGGHAIPNFISDRLKRHVEGLSPLRELASIITISTNNVEVLKDENTTDVGWVSETGKRDETASPQIHKIKIPVHELYARVQVTQRLLDDASIDIENWLTLKIAAKMAQSENLAFIGGDGSEKPKGFLSYGTHTKEKKGKGTFESIRIGDENQFDPDHAFEILIDLMNALKPEYHREAIWVMSQSAHAVVRKFRDKTGQFLWQPSVGEGASPTLLGYKVKVVEGMPEITAQDGPKIPIVFGNFKEAYQIVDRSETHVLRDPYSSKPYVEFYTTRRVGGDVINFDALKMVQFGSED